MCIKSTTPIKMVIQESLKCWLIIEWKQCGKIWSSPIPCFLNSFTTPRLRIYATCVSLVKLDAKMSPSFKTKSYRNGHTTVLPDKQRKHCKHCLASLCTLVLLFISATIMPTICPWYVAANEKNFLLEVMSLYHESGYLKNVRRNDYACSSVGVAKCSFCSITLTR